MQARKSKSGGETRRELLEKKKIRYIVKSNYTLTVLTYSIADDTYKQGKIKNKYISRFPTKNKKIRIHIHMDQTAFLPTNNKFYIS